MRDYKFDRFYYSEDGLNEHYLSEIQNLSDEKYERLYKGKMYCPCCEGPQLTLVRREGKTFLRTYPYQQHVLVDEEMCPYEFDTASKKVVEDYVRELREKKKIKSVLEAVMRKLLNQKELKNKRLGVTDNKEQNPLLIEKVQRDGTIKKNIIPHYCFKSWGKNIPKDQLVIVYGKVYIELKEVYKNDKEGNKKTDTYIHFKDMQSKKLITSCKKPQTLDINRGNYFAVVLGTCHSKEVEGVVYYNLWINFPDKESILLKPISQ